MADAKITQLNNNNTVDDTDLLALVDDVAGVPITEKRTVKEVGDHIVSTNNLSPQDIIVAASDATTAVGAHYVCDGTADEVQINLALADVKAAGGKVVLTDGTFTCAAAVALVGATANADGNPKIILHGKGEHTTILTMASNINGIELTDQPKYDIGFMTIKIAGTGNGIDQQAGTERGNWQSHIHDIFIEGDFSTLTSASWGMYLESPFRMRITNIEMNGMYNGMWLTSHVETFNPGNLSVDRLFVDLWSSATSGTAIKLSTTAVTSTGIFNLATFNRIDVAGAAGLTSSIGIHMIGATSDPGSSYYGQVRHNTFNSLNIEDVQTAIKLEAAPDNSFTNIGYTRVLANGTFIDCDDESGNNLFSNMSVNSKGATDTNNVIVDANTNQNKPNTFERIHGDNASGNTHNATVTSATIIRHIDLSGGSPTVDADLDEDTHYTGDIDFTNANVIGNIRYLVFTLIEKGTDVATGTSIGGDFTIQFSGTILQSDTLHDQLAATTDTAGITGTMVIDIHKNGTTIMTTNKLDIETTEKGTQTATTQPDLTTTTITAGDILTFDIDAIHSGTAAKGTKVLMAIQET